MFFRIPHPVITTYIFKDLKLFTFLSFNFHKCEYQRTDY